MTTGPKRAKFWRSFFRRAGLLPSVLISGVGSLAVLTPPAHGGTPLDPNFRETIFSSDSALNFPTRIAWAPDGSARLFVLHKNGDVRIVQNGILLPAPFVTIHPLHTALECGLTGIAFDPNYLSNRYIYLFATVSSNEQQIIRYTDANNIGINRTILIGNLPTRGTMHNGGNLAIGPDGKLYWGIGDGGDRSGVDGDLTTCFAKICRANLDGSVPRDNPFNDGPGPNNDYIWARGFRAPFSKTFQPGTGLLWVCDVGKVYEQVFAVSRGAHAGYAQYLLNNQPPVSPYLQPTIKYRTNGRDTNALANGGAVRSDNVVTFTTMTAHGFKRGEKITITDVTDTTFNGTVYVASVSSATTFTAAQAGPNAISGGGSAVSPHIGGCVIAGTFYNATAFPPVYRGNFFFGDYNSGRIMRAILDPANSVVRVDEFVSDVNNITVMTVGPDGALYYMRYGAGGAIFRLAAKSTLPGLNVSPAWLTLMEGGQATFSVSLATAPTAEVTVTVARTAGDTDVSVAGGSTLTFSPANYATPQTVKLTAANDPDVLDDDAVVSISAAGLPAQAVFVHVPDKDTLTAELSTTILNFAEGAAGSFDVRLSIPPTTNVAVTVARTAGDSNINLVAGRTLLFTPSNYDVPQTVTITAPHDLDVADAVATVTVSGPGLLPLTVEVTATDVDLFAPVVTSTPPLTAVQDNPYLYAVQASCRPAPRFALMSAPVGMTINPSSGQITWTPTATGDIPVAVLVSNSIAPAATQAFTINVQPDMPPTASIVAPINGVVVSGSFAEWFGNGSDDVGTVRAEFYLDEVLVYMDVNDLGHYHFDGEHQHWDTTTLTDGAHRLRMTVYDAKGQSGSHEIQVTVANRTSVGTGLLGEYFDNLDFTSPILTRTDETVDFNWGAGAPNAAMGSNTFSIRWTGFVQPRYSETYQFYATPDDGVRLWVDGQLIIDRGLGQPATETSGAIQLVAGRKYQIRLEYYEDLGDAVAQLAWSSPTQAKEIIPASQLYPQPEGWSNQDVGEVGVSGSANFASENVIIHASGADIWEDNDSFHYVYRALKGDGEIIARVLSLQNTDPWAKAGVMIREGLAFDSRHAFMAVTAGNGLAFQRRLNSRSISYHTPGMGLAAPCWVRLLRLGNVLYGFRSANGANWVLVGTETITMTTNVLVGLALTSHNNAVLNTAEFDSVRITTSIDSDGDGVSDVLEAVAGTDPEDAKSVLKLTATVSQPPLRVRLTWPSVSSKTYRVLCKTNFAEGAWSEASGDIVATGSTSSWTHLPGPGSPFGFYRLRVLP